MVGAKLKEVGCMTWHLTRVKEMTPILGVGMSEGCFTLSTTTCLYESLKHVYEGGR
jgi:hypothetical protein